MITLKLNNNDLKDFKSFIFLKDFLNQFDFCIYKRRTMKGNFELVKKDNIKWHSNAKSLLRFESYLRNCCNINVENNIIIIGEYALKLKK